MTGRRFMGRSVKSAQSTRNVQMRHGDVNNSLRLVAAALVNSSLQIDGKRTDVERTGPLDWLKRATARRDMSTGSSS
jgi:hypothetical protein